MTTEQQQGGPEWERAEAIQRAAAGVVSGDPDELVRGLSDLGDAVVNATTSRLISGLLSTFEGMVARQIGSLTERIERSDSARLLRTAELQRHIDTRIDTLGGEIDKLSALPLEVRAELSTFLETIDGLALEVRQLKADLTTVGLRAQQRYDELEERDRIKTERLERLEQGLALLAEQTIAHELTADERRRLTATNRAMADILEDLQAIVREWRVRRDHGG